MPEATELPLAAMPAVRNLSLPSLAASVFRGTAVRAAMAVLLAMLATAVLAPWISTHDPALLAPASRLQSPSADHLMGTDALGRDVFSRVVYGTRVSLSVGIGVAAGSVA